MKTLKARGLVLREYEAGEADKRLLLLCKNRGRLMVYARGARKPRSKFLAASQLFTYADFILAEGRGFYSVAQAEVIESFYNLRTDYDRICAAHQITEVCEKNLLENSNCDDVLLLALKSLSLLAKGKFPPAQIIGVFLLKFLDAYGIRPHSEECAICNLPANDTMLEFFWGPEGLLCPKCGNDFKISQAAAAAVSFILNSKLSSAFHFNAHENVLAELHSAANVILRHHLGKCYTLESNQVGLRQAMPDKKH
ncbi:MAG: DNA repair protein RecO [Defluviitaleaceae bacterium]|nr:DNA repair protein RecO [Defluviitaleaceae bacterium]